MTSRFKNTSLKQTTRPWRGTRQCCDWETQTWKLLAPNCPRSGAVGGLKRKVTNSQHTWGKCHHDPKPGTAAKLEALTSGA